MKLLLPLGLVLAGAGLASAQRTRPAPSPPCLGPLDRLFPHPQVATLAGPTSAAIADLDGDGLADLAVGHAGVPTVSLFLGRGGGLLAPRTDVGSATSQALVTLDLEGDGDLDLALSNQASDRIVLLRNQGGGTFVAGGDLGVGDAPGDLSAVDLTLDGRAELVSADAGADRLSVLVNQGGGSFRSAIPFTVGDTPTSLVGLDVERDGRMDVAVACFGTQTVQVLRNLGATFAAPVDLDSFPTPTGVTAADLNGDTYPELVSLSNEASPFMGNVLSVYPNNRQLGLGPASQTYTPKHNQHVTSVDSDGDGDLDLAVVTSGAPSNPGLEGSKPAVILYANDGAGALSLARSRTLSAGPVHAATGDLDGDGLSDLAVVNLDAASVSLLFQRDLASPPRIEAPYAARSLDSADLDGDGDHDLAMTAYFVGSSEAAVQLNQGHGTFGLYASHPVPLAWEIECADLDGDADADLTVGRVDSTLTFLVNQGAGTFASGASAAVGDGVQSIVASDLDGDGDLDLATANETSGDVSMLRNQGGGSFAAPVSIPVQSGLWCGASADLDLDGDRDLVVTSRTPGRVTWLQNDGTASFPARTTIGGLAGAGNLVCADLDRDADLDLAVASLSGASLFLLENLNAGGGSFTAATTVALGGSVGGADLEAADLDRDGHLDLVLPRPDHNAVTLVRGDGTLMPTFRTRHGAGVFPQDSLALDLDGDGDTDVLTLDYWTASVTWLPNGCR